MCILAPKSSASGKIVLDISTNFVSNDGYKRIMQIMQVLGLPVGPCYNFCEKLDARRIDFAKCSISEQVKEIRRSILSSRKKSDDINVLEER